jgi:hypothetical protein
VTTFRKSKKLRKSVARKSKRGRRVTTSLYLIESREAERILAEMRRKKEKPKRST